MTMPPPNQEAQPTAIVTADQLPPPPAPPTPDLGDVAETDRGSVDYDRLVYPGEIVRGGVTLAVLLPDDDNESYFRGDHTAIVQPFEDYGDVKERVITVSSDLVVSEVLATMDKIAEALGEKPAPAEQ